MDFTQNNQTRKQRLSYADQVYNYINDQILSGELKQGDKIVEDKIAQEFGVSRTPIREALTRLRADGLVHLEPRSFAEVATIESKMVKDIAQLRLKLEQMTFNLVCENKDNNIIEKLEEIANAARIALEDNNKANYFKADSLFHLTAAEYCGNKELATVYKRFDGRVQLLRIAQHVSIERLEIYMNQHFDIIKMLKDNKCSAIDELLSIHIIHDLAPVN